MKQQVPDWREFNLKRAGVCILCGATIEADQKAFWSPSRHAVACLSHLNSATNKPQKTEDSIPKPLQEFEPEAPLVIGTPGGSAKKIANQKAQNHEAKVMANHPKLGKVLLALGGENQDTKNWQAGAKGEIAVGVALDNFAVKHGFKVIHDRRIPGSKANIDHIAVTRSGIYVIDAKNYEGAIKIVDKSGFFSAPDLKLYVGGRNCMNLVAGMKRQVEVMKNIIKGSEIDIPVVGVLTFYKAEWDEFWFSRGQIDIQGVLLNSRGIEPIVSKDGQYSNTDIDKLVKLIASKMESAV